MPNVNPNAKYTKHCQCNAASRRHPRCVACGIMPSPITCFMVGAYAILGYRLAGGEERSG